MEKNSLFKRSVPLNDNFNEIYNKIKLLNKHEISKEIDTKYKRFGLDFLNALILNSILDIDSDKSNKSPNQMISFIEKYSQNLINKERRKNSLNNIIKSWHIWFVAIGSFGYFILELTKFILNHCFNIK
jgi:superfamily I DNA and/or RNA helicase